MRIFIVGASGLVGSVVAKTLRDQGHLVLGLARSAESLRAIQAQGFEGIVGDMCEPDSWLKAASNCEAFIHLGMVRPGMRLSTHWLKRAAMADQVAWQGLVLAAQRSNKCKALIYTSGISVYGDHGDDWVKETSLLKPRSVGAMKLAGEKLAMDAMKMGLPTIIMRPGLVYAAQGVFKDFFLQQARKKKFSYIGDGNAYHSCIYIKDLANAYALALEKLPIGEVFNVVDDRPLRWSEFANILLNGFGGGRVKSMPAWLAAIFAGKPLVEMLTASYRVDNQKIKNVLAWQAQYPALSDGIENVIEEFLNQ